MISEILDVSGNVKEGHSQVVAVFEDFYTKLLGKSSSCIPNPSFWFNLKLPCLAPCETLSCLADPISAEEVKSSMFSFDASKTPGPDGFNSFFFTHNWEIVGTNVIKAILFIFDHHSIHPNSNSTFICLIPKKPNLTSVLDFRPISCCNTVFKCVSKILSFRLASVLPSMISPSQTAFISMRSIQSNLLLAHELVRGYNMARCSPRAMLKVDIHKAFDFISWDSLR